MTYSVGSSRKYLGCRSHLHAVVAIRHRAWFPVNVISVPAVWFAGSLTPLPDHCTARGVLEVVAGSNSEANVRSLSGIAAEAARHGQQRAGIQICGNTVIAHNRSASDIEEAPLAARRDVAAAWAWLPPRHRGAGSVPLYPGVAGAGASSRLAGFSGSGVSRRQGPPRAGSRPRARARACGSTARDRPV
jgi:hypothetical protein